MLSLYNIWTVARYELKTLSRSWFFRIFAGLSLVILTLFTVFVLARTDAPYAFRALSASIPYLNFKILNILQAIIVIFLATDFLKRDKKLDSTEVFYARSLTNTDYILGKTIGILLIFMFLNILILGVAAFVHGFFAHAQFAVAPYFIYLVFFSIPTLVFIVGLTLLLMSIIRNQAVTFVLLFAMVGVSLFYITTKYNSVFDILGFFVPSMYSDFVGLAIPFTVVAHRLGYLLLGLSGIMFCAMLLKRLIQSVAMRRVTAFLAVLFLLAGIGFLGYYQLSYKNATAARAEIQKLTREYAQLPAATITDMNLDVIHAVNQMQAKAVISMQNKNAVAIEKYVFTLNPGLVVSKVKLSDTEVGFKQNSQFIIVEPGAPLAPNAAQTLTIEYSGTIDENSLYADVDEEERNQPGRFWLIYLQHRFAFLQSNYVLLTPESHWYPVAGVPYGANYPQVGKRDFVNYELTVTTSPGLSVISQGVPLDTMTTDAGKVKYHFKSDSPLSGLSLVAGEYDKKSIVVDSVEYALYNLKTHNYYEPFFTDLGDTVSALIREVKNSFETTINLSFPFSRLYLVETPVQFYGFTRPYTLNQEFVQPEMVLLSELGVFMESVNFKQMESWSDRRRERSGQTFTPQENQANLFKGFLNSNFTKLTQGRPFFLNQMGLGSYKYEIFSNYYFHAVHIHSQKWPILNQALESFIQSRMTESVPSFFRTVQGLSDQEKANLALDGTSLKDALLDSTNKEIQLELIKNKGNYLFSLLKYELGEDNFDTFLKTFMAANRFVDLPVNAFVNELKSKFNFDFVPHFERWYTDSQIPGYLISSVESEKIMDNERMRYQTRFVIENPEPVPGLIEINFYGEGGRGGRFMGGPPTPTVLESRLVRFKANERKEIGMVVDEAPRRLEINTLISRNIPVLMSERFPDRQDVNDKIRAFNGEKLLPPETKDPMAEIIVDNEDSGFEILSTGKESLLQRLFKSSEDSSKFNKYGGVFYWRPPAKWKPVSDENYYGKFVHSAYVIKSGSGEQKVAWNAGLPESGQYEVYYYPGQPNMPRWMGRRGGPGGPGGRGEERPKGEYHLIVKHDDGEDEIELDLGNIEEGWNSLGTFYFSAGKATVVMTNKSKGDIVFADAVKWAKR